MFPNYPDFERKFLAIFKDRPHQYRTDFKARFAWRLCKAIWSLVALCFLQLLWIITAGVIAAINALIGTILWIAIAFSYAGPSTLSGLYEASLDRKVIKFIQRDNDTRILTPRERRRYAHLLYAVLVGNLKIRHPEFSSDQSDLVQRSPWAHVKVLVKESNSDKTKTRLKAMLNCQAPFGVTIGGPVIFFLGSFLFNTFSTMTIAGDNSTSHALAFGQWWMTVVHVAVLSGCLLAGNNPSTLEVAVCGYSLGSVPNSHYISDPVYDVVWMFERGRSKRTWSRMVQKEWRDLESELEPTTEEEKYFDLKGVGRWLFTMVFFGALLGVPFVLALLTSYYTPTLGLACRSMTFLVCFCSQVWLCLG